MLNADDLGVDLVGVKVANTNDLQTTHSPEARLVTRGVDVSVRYKGVDIRIEKIEQDDNGLLVGLVSSFSNVCSTQYEGIGLGQKITFRYHHVQQSFEN